MEGEKDHQSLITAQFARGPEGGWYLAAEHLIKRIAQLFDEILLALREEAFAAELDGFRDEPIPGCFRLAE